MLQSGDRVGLFVVESEIGVGSTSMVYRVRHPDEGVRALKVLALPHPEIHRRMLQEGRLQSALRHHNIVRVFDLLDVDGCLGLVLEYVEGPSLEAWMQEVDAPLTVRDQLARQIVAAVAHAHRAGLIHRDLKPANILLRQDDRGTWVPKVTDFGLAKVMGAGPQPTDTRTGHALGTPRYMSPEQIRDAKHVDATADVYALGCVLYELYCGEHTFPQGDMLGVFNAVCDGDWRDPLEVAPELPERVTEALRAALSLSPDDRPPDAEALLQMLEDRPLSTQKTQIFQRHLAVEIDPDPTEPEPEPGPGPEPPAPGRGWMAFMASISLGATVGLGVGVLLIGIVAVIVWWLGSW